jgi:hypothetical protein
MTSQCGKRNSECGSRKVSRVLGLIGSLVTGSSAAFAATNKAASVSTNAIIPKKFEDIVPPIDITTIAEWAIRVGAVLLAVGLLAAAWWWWRRKRPATVASERIVPPDERARQRLAAALSLIEDPERFCTSVSEITRTYLEERFGLKAPERTTEEFLAELPNSAVLDSRHKTLLGDFLTQTDLVKFAKFEPGRRELEELHAAALRLVEETAPRFAPPPMPPQSAIVNRQS